MASSLFDTHVHIEADDDVPALLQAARSAGVAEWLIAGTDVTDSLRAQRIAAVSPGVYAAAGVHPHQACGFDGDLAPFRELAAQPGVKAVGEIGLDYHYNFSPPDVQRRVFAAFIQLAAETRLPAIVHCREAFPDCLALLREAATAGVRFVLHSYTGTPECAQEMLALGGFFSFSGMLTFRKADNIRLALAAVPNDRVFLETDSPYLAPVPYRGQRNQPAFLVEIARCFAAERGLALEAAAQLTTANAHRFFGLRDA
jgi:TatD DNase family protein